jgi:tetratricopeptide (TPR) repeat protein
MKFRRNNRFYLIGLVLLVVLTACRDNPERHLQLGRWYLQKGLLDEAILEFREVTRLFPADHRELTRQQFQTLSQAHYNLALAYTKKGWWDYALKEAETCFELQPTRDHYDLVQLIKQRADLEAETATGS